MERVDVLEQNQAGPSPKLVTPSMVPRQNRSNRNVRNWPPPPCRTRSPTRNMHKYQANRVSVISYIYSIFECH